MLPSTATASETNDPSITAPNLFFIGQMNAFNVIIIAYTTEITIKFRVIFPIRVPKLPEKSMEICRLSKITAADSKKMTKMTNKIKKPNIFRKIPFLRTEAPYMVSPSFSI